MPERFALNVFNASAALRNLSRRAVAIFKTGILRRSGSDMTRRIHRRRQDVYQLFRPLTGLALLRPPFARLRRRLLSRRAPVRLPRWPHRSDPAMRRRFRADCASRSPIVERLVRRVSRVVRLLHGIGLRLGLGVARIGLVRLIIRRRRTGRIGSRRRFAPAPTTCSRMRARRERQRCDRHQPKVEASRRACLRFHATDLLSCDVDRR